MVQSLPFSQMLRAKRIVEGEPALEGALAGMAQSFQDRDRGYPQKKEIIEEHKERVLELDRGTLLQKRRPKINLPQGYRLSPQ